MARRLGLLPDIAHQIEMPDLHDLNHTCRYATHLIAMCGGGGSRWPATRRNRS